MMTTSHGLLICRSDLGRMSGNPVSRGRFGPLTDRDFPDSCQARFLHGQRQRLGEARAMVGRIFLGTTVNWPAAGGYASGFVAAGMAVDLFCPRNASARLSRYVGRHFAYEPLAPIRSLERAIGRSVPDLLVACDDRAVFHLLTLFERERKARPDSVIADLIERSLGSPREYKRVLSRNGSMAELRAAGVRVAETLPVGNEAELATCLERIGFPAVLKSDGSWGGEGVAIVRDLDQARAAYRRLANPPGLIRSIARSVKRRDIHHLLTRLNSRSKPICIQRFIPGMPAASAFATWKGDVIGSIYYDVLVADGMIGPPNVIRRVDCPEIDAATRTVARLFRLSGFHGIDSIRDRDGTAHLIEINPRATQGGTLAFGAAHDLPAALAATLSPQSRGLRQPIANDVVVFFPREWRRNLASPYLKSGHHDVPWDDPAILTAALSALSA